MVRTVIMATPSPTKATVHPQERTWVEAARRGDRDAFAQLAQLHGDALFRWACHLCPDVNQAEDVAQETLLKAMTRMEQFTPGTNFRAWLFRIAFNNFANQARSKKKREALVGDLAEDRPGLLETLQREESLRNLAKAITLLPEDFKAALMLRVEGELSFKEIAEVVGTTEETARWRVFRARKILVDMVPEEVPEERKTTSQTVTPKAPKPTPHPPTKGGGL